MTLRLREPRLNAIVANFKDLMKEEKEGEDKSDRKQLENFNKECIFKDKKVLEIGSNIGTLALSIAALCEPKIVVGVDVDPLMISTSIKYMHRVINDEESAALLKEHMAKSAASKSQDDLMLTEEEREKESKLNELIKRVQTLPRSFQLAIQGELQFLNDAKKT